MQEANGEVFNVGTGVPVMVKSVAEKLITNYKKNVPVNISGNYRLGDIRHNFADINKISTRLNFKPVFTFEEGLKQFTDWVNQQEVETDNYTESINEMKSRGLYK